MDLVLGIDSSTTSTKAIAWDRAGTAVAEGRATLPLRDLGRGWMEQSVEDWWQGLGDALPDTAADCFAGYLVDSDLSNESLNHIANGYDLVTSDDSALAQQIIQDNLTECMS